ncbi:hypothetical protein JCM30760_26500 [Thiomicrorhabdus hydrogeniphila]
MSHIYNSGRIARINLEVIKKALGKKRMSVIEELELEPDGVEILLYEGYVGDNEASLTVIEISDCDNQANLLQIARDFVDTALTRGKDGFK